MTDHPHPRPRAVLYASDADLDKAFTPELSRSLTELVDWEHVRPGDPAGPTGHAYLLTGWGAGPVPARLMTPGLVAVFHIGGSLHGLLPEGSWSRDLVVVSARTANAASVAEYALACVIMSAKRATQFAQRLRVGEDYWSVGLRETAGLYGAHVGIVGLSATGRQLLRLLKHLDVRVAVHDPTVSDEEILASGATVLGLDELVSWCDILSVHAPSTPTTRGMIDAYRLGALRDGATVINTARGDLIDTRALEAECATGRIAAYLDVTDPEPLAFDSPLPSFENCFVTPHIAGAMGSDVHRMTAFILDELRTVIWTGSSPYAVSSSQCGLLA